MTGVASRLKRIEDRLQKSRREPDADFWSDKLAVLTDGQLDRLEALYVKILAAQDAAESMPWVEAFASLDDQEQLDLQAIFDVMGVYPEDMAL